MNRVQQTICAVGAICLVALVAMGSDLQRGVTFSTTEHITNTKLHNLIDLADINTTFVTDKSAAQPTASDVFLFVQPGTPIFRKATYNTLLLGATNLITSQSENDLPVTNDYWFMLDSSLGTLAKTPLISMLTNTAGTLLGTPDYTNWPLGGFSYWYGIPGGGGRIEHSNVFAGFYQWLQFSTNVASANPLTNPPIGSIQTAPTNADMLLLWDAKNQATKFTHLDGLITNLPAARPGLTNLDAFMFVQYRTNAVNPTGTNPVLAKVTLADLETNRYLVPIGRLTNTDTIGIWSTRTNASPDATNFVAKTALNGLYQRFVQTNISISLVALTTQGHGLSGRPQNLHVYLECVSADGNYSVGDIVPMEYAETTAPAQVWAPAADASNVYLTQRVNTNIRIVDKNSSSFLTITVANWKAMIVAEYWPHY